MFCPNSLFTNTRADIGPCPLVHDDFLKKEYHEKARKKEKMMFEDEFIRFCQGQLNEVERKIKRAKQRLEMSQQEKNSGINAGNAILSEENQEKIKVITERIDTLLEQIEQLGCEGKVEEAQGIMKLVDKLKDEKSAIKRESMPNNHWIQQKAEIGAQQEKQMEVCDVCGAFLIVNDVQQRVDDHLMGKQHMGFGRLKTALDEILERRRQERDREKAEATELLEAEARKREEERIRRREKSRSPHRDRERDRDRDRDRGRRDQTHIKSRDIDRERDRDKDRDKERDKDRERDKERDRLRHRSSREDRPEKNERSDRDKDREKDRDRGQDRDRERSSRHKHRSSRRSRSRSNEKDRDRERNRSKEKDRKRTKESTSPLSK